MAQTGFTPIQLYYSSTTTNVPLAANLANGELAINITDGKLFYKDNSAAVQVIGWKTVPATAGGTGQTSYAVGDLLYANTTTTLAKLPDVATGNALISGGVGVAPSWGKIGLTTHVSGILPVANGGSGTSTAFTAGSVVFAGASGVYSQDNATFFWDTTNKRLGLGATAPAAALSFSKGDGVTNGIVIGHPNWANTYYAGIYGTVTNGSSNTEGILRFGIRVSATDAALTNAVALVPSGDLQLDIGNLKFSTSGKGIDFSATPGTGTSELLNDYEEGTWTPSIPTGSPTYTDRYGRYTKIGNVVTVFGYIQVATISAPSGFTLISGLPFTAENVSNMYNKFTTAWNSFNIGKSVMFLQPRPNSTDIQAAGCTDNQAFADVNASGFSAGTWLSFTGQYFAA